MSKLSKTFGRIVALDAVSFSVREGEVLGLIGPNGAGKTTLFECLAGLMPIDRRDVTIGGRSVATSERGRHLFYVADGIAPWPAQTVRWALDFTLRFFCGDRARLHAVIQRVSLQPLLDIRLGALSKDQRKRATTLEYTLGSEPRPGRNNTPPNPDLFPANNPVSRPPVAGKVASGPKPAAPVTSRITS